MRAVGARGCVGSCVLGVGSRFGVRGGWLTVGSARDCAENSSVRLGPCASALAAAPVLDA